MSVQNPISILDGVGGTVQAQAFGGTAQPTNPTVPIIANDGKLYVPGGFVQNAVGTGGFTQAIGLTGWRLGAGTATILTGATATNTFFVNNTAGSAYFITAASPTTGLQTAASIVETVVLGPGYTPGTGFTLNVVAQASGGGSLTLSSSNINASVFQFNATTLGLGPLMSTNLAGQVGTSVPIVTTTNGVASGPVTTYSFACVPGTAAPVVGPGTQLEIYISTTITNVSGTTKLDIGAINLSQ